MKTLVIYYSHSGKTKKEAEKLAASVGGELCEVTEVKKRGVFGAYFIGCPQALKRVVPAIRPIGAKLEDYERIYIGAPIWAGHPAPAFNAVVKALPAGREVGLFLTSGSGDSSKSADGTKKLIENKGCNVIEYKDIKIPMKK